jgi:type I restriction enzyme S subunit
MAGGRAATDSVIPGRYAIQWAIRKLHFHPIGSGCRSRKYPNWAPAIRPSRNLPEYWDGDIPWIGIRDAHAHHGGVIADTAQTITELGLQNSAARLLPKDTVCLSRTASVGYVVKMGREMATSQDFVSWSCSGCLDPDFLMKALLAEGDDIPRFGEGSTHTTIYFPEVKAFHIALPPIREQRRIVAKLDSLSSRSNRARAELDRIVRLIERSKHAILSKAFSGELAADRRSENGVVSANDIDLGSVAADITYGSSMKSMPFGDVPVLRMGNIQAGRLDWIDLVYTSNPAEIGKYALLSGDVLFNRTNSPALVGKTAIYHGERPAIYAGYLIRIRCGERLDPEYLTYCLNSPQGREYS